MTRTGNLAPDLQILSLPTTFCECILVLKFYAFYEWCLTIVLQVDLIPCTEHGEERDDMVVEDPMDLVYISLPIPKHSSSA